MNKLREEYCQETGRSKFNKHNLGEYALWLEKKTKKEESELLKRTTIRVNKLEARIKELENPAPMMCDVCLEVTCECVEGEEDNVYDNCKSCLIYKGKPSYRHCPSCAKEL